MNILCILTTWNERDYIPFKIEFCKQNNLDIYVIDNMSDDGTWEYLQENNIPSHQVDTNESFDLRILQKEIVKTSDRIKPDWVIYNGCDLFPITENSLHDEIVELDSKGFNLARIQYASFFNTGEEVLYPFNPFRNFFRMKLVSKLCMIYKHVPNIKMHGDHIDVNYPSPKIGDLEGIMVNYGNTKGKERRDQTLARRQKAWDNGEPFSHGKHYRTGKKENWIWSQDIGVDVRDTEYYPYIQKLQEIGDTVNKSN